MLRDKLTGILGSPILLICLVAATAALLMARHKADALAAAPRIPGYDWSQHPHALLISYPPNDCSCGEPPAVWAKAGLAHGFEVVVIATHPDAKISAVKKLAQSNNKVTLISNMNQAVIMHLSPLRASKTLRIEDGQITKTATGELPPDIFFQ